MLVIITLATKSPWLFMEKIISSEGFNARIGETPVGGVEPEEEV